MSRVISRVARFTLLAAGVVALRTESAVAQGLPAAKDVLAKWQQVSNADAWKSHKSARQVATFEIAAMGMSSKMETVQQFVPAMMKARMELPGMGEILQGVAEGRAWAINPMQGASVTPADQAARVMEDNDAGTYGRNTPAIVSSETVEKAKIGEQECYKVKHTWKSGRTSMDCFSVAEGYLIWSQQTATSANGDIQVTVTYSDYKDFGGVKRAAKSTMDQMGMQIVATIVSYEWDTVKPEELALPAEVKALLEKK